VSIVPTRAKALLMALCGWTAFVWVNRISNAWSSATETTGAKVASTVLAASFLGLAAIGVAALVINWRSAPGRGVLVFVQVFAGWTIGVWIVRITSIVLGDHAVGFKVVHALLGVVSIVLAVAVVRAIRAARATGPERPVLSTAAGGVQ
jgi:hypothetical protein